MTSMTTPNQTKKIEIHGRWLDRYERVPVPVYKLMELVNAAYPDYYRSSFIPPQGVFARCMNTSWPWQLRTYGHVTWVEIYRPAPSYTTEGSKWLVGSWQGAINRALVLNEKFPVLLVCGFYLGRSAPRDVLDHKFPEQSPRGLWALPLTELPSILSPQLQIKDPDGRNNAYWFLSDMKQLMDGPRLDNSSI